jgi:hypothetical protein
MIRQLILVSYLKSLRYSDGVLFVFYLKYLQNEPGSIKTNADASLNLTPF